MSTRSTKSDYAMKRIGNANISKQKIELNNVSKENKSIKLILNLVEKDYLNELDQLILVNELCNKLRKYDIAYSRNEIRIN